jgi:transposase
MEGDELEKCYRSIFLKQQGLSVRSIATKVGIPKSTVEDWLKKYESTGSFERKTGSGRPRLIEPDREPQLERLIQSNREKSSDALRVVVKEKLGVDMSARSMRRYAQCLGYEWRLPLHKGFLTPYDEERRLQFALLHMGKSDWRCVIFSDEATFQLHGGNDRVWIKKGEIVIHEARWPPLSLRVWLGFTAELVCQPYFFKGPFTAQLYKTILESRLPTFTHKRHRQFILLQDKDPRHTAKLTKDFLRGQGVQWFVDWPPYSADLNPMENVWAVLKKEVQSYDPSNLDELQAAIEMSCAKIGTEMRQRLADSMDTRLKCVIEAEGGHTKY